MFSSLAKTSSANDGACVKKENQTNQVIALSLTSKVYVQHIIEPNTAEECQYAANLQN
jgi:hypothetical protein